MLEAEDSLSPSYKEDVKEKLEKYNRNGSDLPPNQLLIRHRFVSQIRFFIFLTISK